MFLIASVNEISLYLVKFIRKSYFMVIFMVSNYQCYKKLF
jgi:hypothetical protein